MRDDHAETFAALITAGYVLPADLRAPVAVALSRRFEAEVAEGAAGQDESAYRPALATVRLARQQGVEVASPRARAALARAVERLVAAAVADPSEPTVTEAVELLHLARELGLVPDLSHSQELVYGALTDDHLDDERRAALAPLGGALGLAVEHLGLPT
jgi:hypothetical protein